jgi:Rrf2 family protein
MKLSRRARYALRMMVSIVRQTNGSRVVSLSSIAQETSMSRRYMEQLAISLKNASLIVGVSGKGGGYMLARSATEIMVDQIVEAAIGPINIVECVGQPDLCMLSDECECRWLYERINQRVTNALSEFSLAELADKYWPRVEAEKEDCAEIARPNGKC